MVSPGFIRKTPPSTRTDSRSRLDWGVTTSIPATFFEGLLIRKAHMLYTLGTLFLCLCDLSIRCTHIQSLYAFAIMPVLFLFLLGDRTGSLLGFISISLLLIFTFWYSLPLHIPDFHVRYSRTPPFYWECTVSVCIVTLSSVFVLCVFFSPHTFGGLYIWRAIYIWRSIYIWRAISIWRPISVWRALFTRLRPGSSWHFDTNCVKNGDIDL